MKVLVCGSRDYVDRATLFATLDALHEARGIDLVIHGDADGADRLGKKWAQARGVRETGNHFEAKWSDLTATPCKRKVNRRGEYYNAFAGFNRNQAMIDEGRPDYYQAFVSKPLRESRGTADMVRRLERAGIQGDVIGG